MKLEELNAELAGVSGTFAKFPEKVDVEISSIVLFVKSK